MGGGGGNAVCFSQKAGGGMDNKANKVLKNDTIILK